MQRADVVEAGNVLSQQYGVDARHEKSGGGVPLENPGLGVRGTDGPKFQRGLVCGLVVGVLGRAGDMEVGAFVGRRDGVGRMGVRGLMERMRLSKKLLEQGGNQAASIAGAASDVGDGREL